MNALNVSPLLPLGLAGRGSAGGEVAAQASLDERQLSLWPQSSLDAAGDQLSAAGGADDGAEGDQLSEADPDQRSDEADGDQLSEGGVDQLSDEDGPEEDQLSDEGGPEEDQLSAGGAEVDQLSLAGPVSQLSDTGAAQLSEAGAAQLSSPVREEAGSDQCGPRDSPGMGGSIGWRGWIRERSSSDSAARRLPRYPAGAGGSP